MRTAIAPLAFMVSLQPSTAVSAPLLIAQANTMTTGEVRNVDKEQGKITIRHEPIASLGTSAMTMVFRVKDLAMLDQVTEGDKIQSTAERVGGSLTAVQWQPAR